MWNTVLVVVHYWKTDFRHKLCGLAFWWLKMRWGFGNSNTWQLLLPRFARCLFDPNFVCGCLNELCAKKHLLRTRSQIAIIEISSCGCCGKNARDQICFVTIVTISVKKFLLTLSHFRFSRLTSHSLFLQEIWMFSPASSKRRKFLKNHFYVTILCALSQLCIAHTTIFRLVKSSSSRE